MQDTAYLSSNGKYSYFKCGNYVFTYRTSERMVKYLSVKEWDPAEGYIVVDVLHDTYGVVEDYIDLMPMLDNLYVDAKKLLAPIKRVEVKYA